MLSKKENRIIKQTWFKVALYLMLIGFFLLYIANTIELDASKEYLRAILNSLAGAAIAVALIDVFHEYFVARDIRHQFKILSDFKQNGVERVCAQEEVNELGYELISKTNSLKAIGIGLQWLMDETEEVEGKNQKHLLRILNSKTSQKAYILIPDPCSNQIKERYVNDEPNHKNDVSMLGLKGIAGAVRKWNKLRENHKDELEVKVYHRYPMANVTIYDDYVFVSAVLYKHRAKDGFTVIYRRGSKGAQIYENHFNEVYKSGSIPLDDYYIKKLNNEYLV